MSATQLLTLSRAVRAMYALQELHRVCLAMDAEVQGERPSDDEYQAAMAEAGDVLRDWAQRNV